jgi:adenine phosphoribosyltransferase
VERPPRRARLVDAGADTLGARHGRLTTEFRTQLLSRFRWIDGHADILGLVADGEFLRKAGAVLVEPFRDLGVTKVAAVEARGFVFGSAAALALGVGFVPIRKAGAIHPGPKARSRTARDWRGHESLLEVQRHALVAEDLVLVVDDWAETGSQALSARELIEACGAAYMGLTVLVDQLEDGTRNRLAPVAAVVTQDELPPSA